MASVRSTISCCAYSSCAARCTAAFRLSRRTECEEAVAAGIWSVLETEIAAATAAAQATAAEEAAPQAAAAPLADTSQAAPLAAALPPAVHGNEEQEAPAFTLSVLLDEQQLQVGMLHAAALDAAGSSAVVTALQ